MTASGRGIASGDSNKTARDIFLAVLVTVPFGLLMAVSYRQVRTDLTEPTVSRREALMSLAAVTVREMSSRTSAGGRHFSSSQA